MSKDKDYIKLINSTRWQRLRAQILSERRLCQRCKEQGKIKAAREVHHITPVEQGMTYEMKAALAYNPNNLMALCHDCHVAIHREQWYLGKNVKERAKQQCDRFDAKFFGTDTPG